MIELAIEEAKNQIVSIKVIGVGGAGGNTVNSIIETGCQGIDSLVFNTDAQALEKSKASTKVQIGIKSTKGLGTGANPELGKRSAEEDIDKILEAVGDADIVFLTAGMGGGTGSGGLPVIAKALREHGILSIAIVTKPFVFEGKRRSAVAQEAIEHLRNSVDTLIVIPNQKLLEVVDKNVSMIDAFGMINEVLSQSVTGISDIITKPGHINVDFADVRTIMKDTGLAVLGTGRASGENRAQEAALQAISSPLLENMSIEGAHGVLFNITGGNDLGIHEISQAASIIYEQADQDANIILGSVIDPSMEDEVSVTIIATGFSKNKKPQEPAPSGLNRLVTKYKPEAPKQEPASVHVQPAAVKSAEVQQVQEKQEESKKEAESITRAGKETKELSEEELFELELQAEQQGLHATENKDAQKEQQEVQEGVGKSDESIDLDDLDVPTFLRKEAQGQAKNE